MFPLASLTSLLLSTLLAPGAQDPGAPTPAAAPLPAAGSDEATALLDTACAKMLALARGSFRTEEQQDNAMLRGQNLPIGGGGPSVRGGWSGDLVWGETEDDTFVVGGGRMVAKTDAGWKLRARTLPSGQNAPFLLSPALLFEQLQGLPAEHKRVTHVEAGDVAGRPVAILTLSCRGDVAADLALGGALPAPGSGMMLGIGGMFGAQLPEKTYAADLALFVDPLNGDVLRLRAKVYEDNPMLANMRFQVRNAGGGDVEVEDDGPDEAAATGRGEGAAEGAADAAGPQVKKGLPERQPGKSESVAYLKVDFKNLGVADAPELDEHAKRWLRTR